MKCYNHLLGKTVRVVDEFNGRNEVGVLSSQVVDWQCDAEGETIYTVNGQFITDGDEVSEV